MNLPLDFDSNMRPQHHKQVWSDLTSFRNILTARNISKFSGRIDHLVIRDNNASEMKMALQTPTKMVAERGCALGTAVNVCGIEFYNAKCSCVDGCLSPTLD